MCRWKQLLTMRICHHCGACLGARPTEHDLAEVPHRLLLAAAGPVLVLGQQPLLEGLVDDEVDDGLADAPVGGGHALPEAQDALRERKGGKLVSQWR